MGFAGFRACSRMVYSKISYQSASRMNLARIKGWIDKEPVFKETKAGLIAQFDLLVTEGDGDDAYEMEIPVYVVQSALAETLKSLWTGSLEAVVEGKLGAFSKSLKDAGVEYVALKVVLSDPDAHSVKAFAAPGLSTDPTEIQEPVQPVADRQPSPQPVAPKVEHPPQAAAPEEPSNPSTSAAPAEAPATAVRMPSRSGPPSIPPVSTSKPSGGGLRSLPREGGLRENHPSGPLSGQAPRTSRMTIGQQLGARGGVGRLADFVVGHATGAQPMDRAGRPTMPDINDEIPW